MDAVTYPQPEVESLLNEQTIPVHINTVDPDEGTRRLMREYRQVWTPTLLFLDHHGIEVRREVGFIEAGHFIQMVRLAVGQAHLLNTEFKKAMSVFDEVGAAGHPAAAPEALYWAGVAGLRQGDRGLFVDRWHQLRDAFPDSTWWARASFIDHPH